GCGRRTDCPVANDHSTALARRRPKEEQLAALQGKHKPLDRAAQLLQMTARQLQEHALPPLPADASPLIDESKLLQAVVDTQEAERKRIARQVHDGPA